MRHQWVCVASIRISEEEAAEALRTGKVDRDVTLKDVDYMGMGCYVCELPLTLETYKGECTGEPES